MDPQHSAQDALRCHLCETPVPPMYCDICDICLCAACVGKHLLDESTEHKVVPFKKKGSILKCPKHPSKYCELHCEHCDIPICLQCISLDEHENHKKADIFENFENKKDVIRKDLQELKKSIHPKYQEFATIITVQKTDLDQNSKKMTKAIKKHGENLHKEIDIIIKKLHSDLDEMDSIQLANLHKQEEEITSTVHKIEQSISELNMLLNSNDVSLVSAYKSRNAEFRKVPPKPVVSMPCFVPQKINKEQIYQLFGSLSASSIKSEGYDYTMDSRGAESDPPLKPLIDVPRIITDITTDYGENLPLFQLSCLTDEEIWVRIGSGNLMRLYNLRGKILKSIQTRSGNEPSGIAVTKSGDLTYTDENDRTVNIVKNTQIQTVIKLHGWKPLSVCSTSTDDLLVAMISDDKQSKIVRYSGSKEIQSIQYNNKRLPIFSFQKLVYMTESRNLDICVSNSCAFAVVVVNPAGKLRFRYSGGPIYCNTFNPLDITTDNQMRILIADLNSQIIHILNQYGQVLGYINSCNLEFPTGVCVDSRDYLFVSEWRAANGMKKIQYNM